MSLTLHCADGCDARLLRDQARLTQAVPIGRLPSISSAIAAIEPHEDVPHLIERFHPTSSSSQSGPVISGERSRPCKPDGFDLTCLEKPAFQGVCPPIMERTIKSVLEFLECLMDPQMAHIG